MLDMYCGRLGVGKVFAERGWDVVGIDVAEPSEIPQGVTFIKRNALEIDAAYMRQFDFGWASSPCEEFSVHGMKHFHPNPKFPDMGLVLFCWTRRQFELSGIPFSMENVRAAQQFVGDAENHAGPFYLWGNAVPPLMPIGITKGIQHAAGFHRDMDPEEKRLCRLQDTMLRSGSKSKVRKEHTARAATIPTELANCVADYAGRLCEVTA